jgi:hypothetical protein
MNAKKECDYFIMILNNIAKKYDLKIFEVYNYLSKYEGIRFLQEFYDVEHTLNTEDVIDDLIDICNKNGGTLS